MSFLLKEFFSLLRILGSETESRQIAAGFAFGFVLGMTPFLSLQSFLIFFLVFVFRVQIGAFFLSSFFFSFFAFLLDPLFHLVGNLLLEWKTLWPFYTFLYNTPLFPYTGFNNSLVMGSSVISILLLPFVYFVSYKMVEKYRIIFMERFKNSKLWKVVKKTFLFSWYEKWKSLQ